MKNSAATLLLPLICLGLTACLGATESYDDASIDEDVPMRGQLHLLPVKSPEASPPLAASSITLTQATGAKLKDYGGAVLTNVKVIPVYWNSSVAYRTELNAFYGAIVDSDYFDLLGQYDTIGHGTFGTPFVSSQTSTTVTDAAIRTALKSMFASGQVATPTSSTYYPVHFPSGVSITASDGSKSCVGWCAYHSSFVYNNVEVAYGVHPDLDSGGCSSGCGNDSLTVNNLTTVASHELFEAITDPDVGEYSYPAWYDTTNGEISDICSWQKATVLGTDDASYAVQRQFSNKDDNCVWWSEPNKLTNQVLVYSELNYAGDVQALYPGDYSGGSTLTIGNDTLSSLRIPTGWTVTLYADNSSSGASLTLTSDTKSLAKLSFDNVVSNITVTGPSESFPVIYKDINYLGSSQTLRPGVYNTSSDLTFGNDAVSSISIPSGWSVTLFKDLNFGGTSVTYTSSASSLGTFNDQTTSIKVTGPSVYETPVVIYKDPSYTGTAQALWPGHYGTSNLTIGEDTLSSLTVPTGWTVYLLKSSSSYSAMKAYTSRQPSLFNDGYDDVTSEIVVVGPS